jgi:hypothetical protein
MSCAASATDDVVRRQLLLGERWLGSGADDVPLRQGTPTWRKEKKRPGRPSPRKAGSASSASPTQTISSGSATPGVIRDRRLLGAEHAQPDPKGTAA